MPDELADVMDAAKLDQARDYLRVNARFGIIQSTVSLGVLLVFWFARRLRLAGRTGALVRRLAEVAAGLVFLSAAVSRPEL